MSMCQQRPFSITKPASLDINISPQAKEKALMGVTEHTHEIPRYGAYREIETFRKNAFILYFKIKKINETGNRH